MDGKMLAELENVRLAVESMANLPWWNCWSVQSVDGFYPLLVLYVVNHVCVLLRITTQVTCLPSPKTFPILQQREDSL